MNENDKLRLQAYVDNELSERELRQAATWAEQDSEARSLCAELKQIKAIVAGNELPIQLPESREFYWSKIERTIRQEAERPAPATPGFLPGYPRWFRIFAPATGAAILMAVGLFAIKLSTAPSALAYLHEIETSHHDSSAIVFHSQAAGMTVVWVQTQ